MFYVYAVYNRKHRKMYIGQIKDIAERLNLHNNKIFNNSYTSRFDGEWELIYQKEHKTRQEALKREEQLKSYRGREFIKQFII